jgi:hypothetical protein
MYSQGMHSSYSSYRSITEEGIFEVHQTLELRECTRAKPFDMAGMPSRCRGAALTRGPMEP